MSVCCRCGNPTEWDNSLGVEPYCAGCWDSSIDAQVVPVLRLNEKTGLDHRCLTSADYQHAYYLLNKTRLVRYKKTYYQSHRVEMDSKHQLYMERRGRLAVNDAVSGGK